MLHICLFSLPIGASSKYGHWLSGSPVYILSIFPVTQGFSKFSHHYRFFDQFLGAFEKFWKATISFIMSVAVSPFVRMEQLGFQWTDFHKILYWVFFENLLRKLEFHYNVTRITGSSSSSKHKRGVPWRTLATRRSLLFHCVSSPVLEVKRPSLALY